MENELFLSLPLLLTLFLTLTLNQNNFIYWVHVHWRRSASIFWHIQFAVIIANWECVNVRYVFFLSPKISTSNWERGKKVDKTRLMNSSKSLCECAFWKQKNSPCLLGWHIRSMTWLGRNVKNLYVTNTQQQILLKLCWCSSFVWNVFEVHSYQEILEFYEYFQYAMRLFLLLFSKEPQATKL